ncbi:MAG: hypothetical protein Q8R25_04475 [bacterium]|nr:hypothetical protein [bacterium]
MSYEVVPESTGPGKFVLWKKVRGPTLEEVLEAAKKEFPRTPKSKLRIDHGLYVSLTNCDGLPKF